MEVLEGEAQTAKGCIHQTAFRDSSPTIYFDITASFRNAIGSAATKDVCMIVITVVVIKDKRASNRHVLMHYGNKD